MKSETRANLIFIVVILAVTIPGAVMLFRKKLDPAAPPMYLPDAIKRRLPYMAPLPTPDEVTRFVPTLTGQWVARVSRDMAEIAQVREVNRVPIISDDRRIQLVDVQKSAASETAYLIAWDAAFGPNPQRYRAEVLLSGNQTIAARVLDARPVPMPENVKHELMNAGFIKPPRAITWMAIQFDAPSGAPEPTQLTLEYRGGDATERTSVNLFTDTTSHNSERLP